MSYSVGEVSRIAHVTVRTLHHYDQIGLLRPSGRTDAGYRSYSHADLERLQRIRCYRELGFALDQISAIVDRLEVDPLDQLRRQHGMLTGRIEQLRRMVATLEKTMEARKMGINLDPHEMFEVFGDADPRGYAEEAERRWGHLPEFQESQRRMAAYGKDDLKRMMAEHRELQGRFAAAQAAGTPADAPQAMDLAEEHRQQLNRWSYDCGYELHRRIGDLYVQEPRFSADYDKVAPELERYVRDAIHANADRRTGS